jgi:hypothetical protein
MPKFLYFGDPYMKQLVINGTLHGFGGVRKVPLFINNYGI